MTTSTLKIQLVRKAPFQLISSSVERLIALLEENNWDHRLVGQAVDGFNYVANQALHSPYYYMGDTCFIGSDPERKELTSDKIRQISLFIHRQNSEAPAAVTFKAEVLHYLDQFKKGGSLKKFRGAIANSREQRHAVMKRGPFLMRADGTPIPWTQRVHYPIRVS